MSFISEDAYIQDIPVTKKRNPDISSDMVKSCWETPNSILALPAIIPPSSAVAEPRSQRNISLGALRYSSLLLAIKEVCTYGIKYFYMLLSTRVQIPTGALFYFIGN